MKMMHYVFQEDEKDILPIGRMSRDSAIFRKEGDTGIMVRNLVMGKLLICLLEILEFLPLSELKFFKFRVKHFNN